MVGRLLYAKMLVLFIEIHTYVMHVNLCTIFFQSKYVFFDSEHLVVTLSLDFLSVLVVVSHIYAVTQYWVTTAVSGQPRWLPEFWLSQIQISTKTKI